MLAPDGIDLTQLHLCYTLDHNEDEAAAIFRQRFGVPPDHIVEQSGLLWLGPIPETQEDERCNHT